MNNIIPFSFEDQPVRSVVVNGDPWFVADDVCGVLQLKNARVALKALDLDERGKFNLHPGCEVNIINESGLFTLILRSRQATTPGTLPHRFRRWVAGEVLPTIRKTGSYNMKQGWQRPETVDAAATLLRGSSFLMTTGQDGRVYLTQMRGNEKFLDVNDPSDLARLILNDMPESFLPQAAELLMCRALAKKQPCRSVLTAEEDR